MSYKARVFKVFIASSNDVSEERRIIRESIAKWNAVHSKEKNIVLLPVGYDTDAVPEVGQIAQEYINTEVLADCDFLIAVFWSRVGIPTLNEKGGTISEIKYHTKQNKPAMIYFSRKPLPSDVSTEQVNELRAYKKELEHEKCFYWEYDDEHDFAMKVYQHIEKYISEGKLRTFHDSDRISSISDDSEMAKEIRGHFPLVAKNVFIKIFDEKHDAEVWEAIIQKLQKSPADLRDALIFVTDNGGFKNPAFEKGYISLAKRSQHDYFNFLMNLYRVNKVEFNYVYEQNLLIDGPNLRRLNEIIENDKFVK